MGSKASGGKRLFGERRHDEVSADPSETRDKLTNIDLLNPRKWGS